MTDEAQDLKNALGQNVHLSAGLGLFCIRKKRMNRLKQGIKVGLGVFRSFGSRNRKNATFQALVAALAISYLGFAEAGTLEPRDIRAKGLDGGQMLHMVNVDNLGDGNIALGEVKDSVGKGGSELIFGNSKPAIALAPQSEPVSGKRSKKNASESYQCDGYCGLYLSLPMFLAALWAGTYIPNYN